MSRSDLCLRLDRFSDDTDQRPGQSGKVTYHLLDHSEVISTDPSPQRQLPQKAINRFVFIRNTPVPHDWWGLFLTKLTRGYFS